MPCCGSCRVSTIPATSTPIAHEGLPPPLSQIRDCRLGHSSVDGNGGFLFTNRRVSPDPVVADHRLDHAGLLVGVHPDHRRVDLPPQGHIAADGPPPIVCYPVHTV